MVGEAAVVNRESDQGKVSSFQNPQKPVMFFLFALLFVSSVAWWIFLYIAFFNEVVRLFAIVACIIFSCLLIYVLIETEIMARPTNVTITPTGLELTFVMRRHKSLRWEDIDMVGKSKPASVEKQGGIIKPHDSRKLWVSYEIAMTVKGAYAGEHHFENIYGSEYLFRNGVSYDAKKGRLKYS